MLLLSGYCELVAELFDFIAVNVVTSQYTNLRLYCACAVAEMAQQNKDD